MQKIVKKTWKLLFSVLLVSLKGFAVNANGGSVAKEIVFSSSKDGVQLKGTLTLPKEKPKGYVLMLVGSGQVDRDETTPPSRTFSGKTEKLFAQLSDSLASAGYATFRYDKRGVLDENGKVDPKIWQTADRDHLVSDGIDAAKTLLKKVGSSPEHLIILGHSEGTILATEVAISLGGKVQSLLLLGAQARSMKDMLHYQIVESRSKRGSGIGESGTPEDEYKKALEMIENSKETFAPDGKPMAWYRQHMAAPANSERLHLVTAKKFVFQGETDPQTPIDETDRFLKAGIKDIVIKRYPALGHGFSPDKDGKPTLGPIDQKVLSDIVMALKSI